MALILIVAGLTGSILAFYDELDDWLNSESSHAHTRIAVQAAPLLNPFELRERGLKRIPKATNNYLDLQAKPDEAYTLLLVPRLNPASGQPYPLDFDTLKLNPYTGYEIERINMMERYMSGPHFPLTRKNILQLICALHDQLALGEIGGWIMGIAALIWTVDCFVGVYLTLPPKRKKSPTFNIEQRSFWPRWKPSWLVKWRSSAFRVNFDLHRAGGLWVWIMLFILAWSSVMFNLPQVYHPRPYGGSIVGWFCFSEPP
jgi:uncharacterized iron-regulated membrane protein